MLCKLNKKGREKDSSSGLIFRDTAIGCEVVMIPEAKITLEPGVETGFRVGVPA
jgi:hypothetical protein